VAVTTVELTNLIIAAAAFAVASASLALAIYLARLERPEITAWAMLGQDVRGERYLTVQAVNHGRRPVLLTYVRVRFPTAPECDLVIEARLSESEPYSIRFEEDDERLRPAREQIEDEIEFGEIDPQAREDLILDIAAEWASDLALVDSRRREHQVRYATQRLADLRR
jgi:hypothetical protein